MQIGHAFLGVVTDQLAESRSFYTRYLGFRVVCDMDWYLHLAEPGGRMEIGFLKPNHPSQPPAFHQRFQSPGGMWICLEVPDAEAEFHRLSAVRARITVPLSDEPWGERHFVLLDPSGVPINIAQRIPADPNFVAEAFADLANAHEPSPPPAETMVAAAPAIPAAEEVPPEQVSPERESAIPLDGPSSECDTDETEGSDDATSVAPDEPLSDEPSDEPSVEAPPVAESIVAESLFEAPGESLVEEVVDEYRLEDDPPELESTWSEPAPPAVGGPAAEPIADTPSVEPETAPPLPPEPPAPIPHEPPQPFTFAPFDPSQPLPSGVYIEEPSWRRPPAAPGTEPNVPEEPALPPEPETPAVDASPEVEEPTATPPETPEQEPADEPTDDEVQTSASVGEAVEQEFDAAEPKPVLDAAPTEESAWSTPPVDSPADVMETTVEELHEAAPEVVDEEPPEPWGPPVVWDSPSEIAVEETADDEVAIEPEPETPAADAIVDEATPSQIEEVEASHSPDEPTLDADSPVAGDWDFLDDLETDSETPEPETPEPQAEELPPVAADSPPIVQKDESPLDDEMLLDDFGSVVRFESQSETPTDDSEGGDLEDLGDEVEQVNDFQSNDPQADDLESDGLDEDPLRRE